MPDCLTHLAMSAAACQMAGGNDFSIWALGAVLPDLPRLLRPLLVRALRQDHLRTEMYLEALHTPVAASLFAGAAAISSSSPMKTFLTLSCAALLHLILDCMQAIPGRYPLLLFPLSRRRLLPGLLDPDARYMSAAALISLPFVVWTLAVSPSTQTAFTFQYPALGILLVSLWWILPMLSAPLCYPVPGSELDELSREQRHDKWVAISEAEIVNPRLHVIERLGRRFRLIQTEELPARGFISLNGWLDGASIRVHSWRLQPYRLKVALTLIGLTLAAVAWLR